MKSVTGYNLISKAGKNSNNRYKILAEKGEILGIPEKKHHKKILKTTKKILVLEMLKNASDPQVKPALKYEESEKLDQSKLTSPKPFEVPKEPESHLSKLKLSYTPSYKAQDKHIPTIKFKQTVTLKRTPAERIFKKHKHSSISIKSSISESSNHGLTFEKQLSRDFHWMQQNLSEKRFDYSPAPEAIKSVPSFEKQVSRDQIHKTQLNSPDYHPQKEKFLKKISQNIQFDKYLTRDSNTQLKFLPDNYDVKFTSIDPKPKICRFSKPILHSFHPST